MYGWTANFVIGRLLFNAAKNFTGDDFFNTHSALVAHATNNALFVHKMPIGVNGRGSSVPSRRLQANRTPLGPSRMPTPVLRYRTMFL